MYLCVCEPEISLLLLIVLHALLPKGSNNTNLLHAQCLSRSFCLSFTLSVTLLTTLLSLSASIGPECFGVWVLCEGSCNSEGLLACFACLIVCVCVFKLYHDTELLTVWTPFNYLLTAATGKVFSIKLLVIKTFY